MEEEQRDNTPSKNQDEQTLTKKQRRALKKREKREERKRAEQAKTARAVFGWLGAVSVIALGLWWLVLSSNAPDDVSVPPQSEIAASDWTKGGLDAPVRIIEYSDFQCPACASYFPIVRQLLEEFGDDVRFAYRHYPLRTIHPNAEEAARAAEAAGVQGKFWEMHDTLFDDQDEWRGERNPFDLFAGYADDLGLDAVRFEADYESSAAKDKVRSHEAAGRRLGVAGTPTFVVNGEQIENPAGYEAFRSLVVSIVGEPGSDVPDETGDEETATTTDDTFSLP